MKKLILCAGIGLSIWACTKEEKKEEGADINQMKTEMISNYSDIVSANYEDILSKTQVLNTAINDFLTNPTQQGLDNAKSAWLDAREYYGQSETFRFYGGPIDGDNGVEDMLNAWPLDENLIDYVEGASTSGLIYDVDGFGTISGQALETMNGTLGETHVIVGWHAIEFMLWGQDLNANGPGARSVNDFITDGGDQDQYKERRATYLKECMTLLIGHLTFLTDQWKSGGQYRTYLAGLGKDEAIKNILSGAGVLSKAELASERIYTPYANPQEEEEHSCFSDNTHRDIYTNFTGIKNVLTGKYKKADGSEISGTSIFDILNEVDASKKEALTTKMNTVQTKMDGMPTPFDKAIIEEASRTKIIEIVNVLQDLGDEIAKAGNALGITVNNELPE